MVANGTAPLRQSELLFAELIFAATNTCPAKNSLLCLDDTAPSAPINPVRSCHGGIWMAL